jgi:hypothetical protein
MSRRLPGPTAREIDGVEYGYVGIRVVASRGVRRREEKPRTMNKEERRGREGGKGGRGYK